MSPGEAASAWSAGDTASVAGLVVGVLGLMLSFATLVIAEKARQAAKKARDAVRTSNAIQDLARAIEILGEIKRHHISRQWAFAHERYSAARKLIIEVRTATKDVFHTADRERLTRCIQLLGNFESDAADHLRDETEEPNAGRLDRRVREMEEDLSSLLGVLESQEW